MLDDRDLVAIASFESLPEAEVARSLLAAEGIAVVVRDEALASLLPAVAATNGGIVLCVAEDEVERAREVLASPDSAEPPPEEEMGASGPLADPR